MMEFEPIAKMKPGSAEPIYWNKTFKEYPESVWALTDMLDIYRRTGQMVNDITPVASWRSQEGCFLCSDATGNMSWVIPEMNNLTTLNE